MFSVIFEVHPEDHKRDSYMGYANSSDTEATKRGEKLESVNKTDGGLLDKLMFGVGMGALWAITT